VWARPGNKVHAYPSSSFSPCERQEGTLAIRARSFRIFFSFHSVIYSAAPALIYISLYQRYYLASPGAYFQRHAASLCFTIYSPLRSLAMGKEVTGIVGGFRFSLLLALLSLGGNIYVQMYTTRFAYQRHLLRPSSSTKEDTRISWYSRS